MFNPFTFMAPIPEDDEQAKIVGTYINLHGFKQMINGAGEDVCISCALPYTNKGEGVLCEPCYNLVKNNLEELE